MIVLNFESRYHNLVKHATTTLSIEYEWIGALFGK